MGFLEGESVKLLQGDCLEVMKSIPDGSIDFIVTDPPYGTTQCKWDCDIDLLAMWKELHRIVKVDGAICVFGAEPFSSHLRMSNIKNFKYDFVWEKSKATGFLNAKRQPLRAHEFVSVFYRKQCTYNPQMTQGAAYDKGVRKQQTNDDVYGGFEQVQVKSDGLRYPRSVQYFKTAESEGGYHKTQKPVALLEYLIKTYSNEQDVVMDCFMGSGSTGVAAKNLSRRFTGIELDPDYFAIAKNRIENT